MSGGAAEVLNTILLSVLLQLTSESSENKKETGLQSGRRHGGVAKGGQGGVAKEVMGVAKEDKGVWQGLWQRNELF